MGELTRKEAFLSIFSPFLKDSGPSKAQSGIYICYRETEQTFIIRFRCL